jgi:cell division protein FtsW (lipid II flippase)
MDALSDSVRKRLAVAAWIFVAVGVVQGVQAVADAIPKHAFDPSWLDHARFHVVVGAANQLGFAIAAILVALIPFRRGERWSWWMLLNFALLSTVALIPATVWQGSGPPPAAWLIISACITAMLVGLLLTLEVGFRRGLPSVRAGKSAADR